MTPYFNTCHTCESKTYYSSRELKKRALAYAKKVREDGTYICISCAKRDTKNKTKNETQDTPFFRFCVHCNQKIFYPSHRNLILAEAAFKAGRTKGRCHKCASNLRFDPNYENIEAVEINKRRWKRIRKIKSKH